MLAPFRRRSVLRQSYSNWKNNPNHYPAWNRRWLNCSLCVTMRIVYTCSLLSLSSVCPLSLLFCVSNFTHDDSDYDSSSSTTTSRLTATVWYAYILKLISYQIHFCFVHRHRRHLSIFYCDKSTYQRTIWNCIRKRHAPDAHVSIATIDDEWRHVFSQSTETGNFSFHDRIGWMITNNQRWNGLKHIIV